MIYHIVATAQNGVIGKNNQLPWHFSCDLKFFKETTFGQTVLMGRKTFESIGKPLPGRENFILTKNPKKNTEQIKYFDSIQDALASFKTKHCFIIGGALIYKQTLQEIDGIYQTRIHADYEGDAFYPEIPDTFIEKKRQILQESDPKIEALFFERKRKDS